MCGGSPLCLLVENVWVCFLFSCSRCRGDYTGEEMLITTLVLPSVYSMVYIRFSFVLSSDVGEITQGRISNTLVLPL